MMPQPEWQLLYKAGPEVIYQHLQGPNAQENIAKANRLIGTDGSRSEGGKRWLADPWRASRMAMDAKTPEGKLRNARRLYRADQYRAASDAFEEALQADGEDKMTYLWAAAAFHRAGDLEQSRNFLRKGLSELRRAPPAPSEGSLSHPLLKADSSLFPSVCQNGSPFNCAPSDCFLETAKHLKGSLIPRPGCSNEKR